MSIFFKIEKAQQFVVFCNDDSSIHCIYNIDDIILNLKEIKTLVHDYKSKTR